MKSWVIALLWLTTSGLVAAEPPMRLSPKNIRDEVRAVVETQLAALREGDFARAHELASSALRAQFDVRLFAALIRRGYPALLRAGSTDLGVVRDQEGEQAQINVTVTDRAQRRTSYRFWLVREEAEWRINGVTLEQRPPHGDI